MADAPISDEKEFKAFADQVTKALANFEEKRRVRAFAKFAAHISPEIRAILRDTKIHDMKTLNWLHAEGDPQTQKRRLQAAQAYPLLIPALQGNHLSGWNPTASYRRRVAESEKHQKLLNEYELFVSVNEKLRQAIDNAEPISDLLAQCMINGKTLSKGTIRTLGKIKKMPEDMENFAPVFLDTLPYLDELDRNQHPKTPQELSDYVECVKRARAFESVLGTPAIDTLKSIKGRWAEWKEKSAPVQAIDDIKDWFDAVNKMLVLPQAIAQLPENLVPAIYDRSSFFEIYGFYNVRSSAQTFDSLLESKPIDIRRTLFAKASDLDLLACSVRWHEQGEEYRTQKESLGIAHIGELNSWGALSKPVQAPNGLWLRPLTTREELNIEGEAMGHCVGWGGYDAKCLTGRGHIISVSRDGKDDRLSTVELSEEFNRAGHVTGLKIKQHQGRGGVSKKEQAAAAWYVKQIFKDADMAVDWDAIEAKREKNREIAAKIGLAVKIGFDPLQAENCRRAYEVIRPFLPARFQHLDYDAALAKPDISTSMKLENTSMGQLLLDDGIIFMGDDGTAIDKQTYDLQQTEAAAEAKRIRAEARRQELRDNNPVIGFLDRLLR